MTSTDARFAGSIPAIYDRYLTPLLFEPYARDLAERAGAMQPRSILEIAAGTGVVTAALVEALPDATIVATDLNRDMLALAALRIDSVQVTIEPADAQALPYPDASFDLVVCQFGIMFFPDRIGAYREALRVLRPGGYFLFNAWDRIHRNPLSQIVATSVASLFPMDAPSFLDRTPFGYHDVDRLKNDAQAAGFREISLETVEKRSRSPSARDGAIGLCHGSPLRAEIEQRGDLVQVTEAATAALAKYERPEGIDLPMSAHVVSARKPG